MKATPNPNWNATSPHRGLSATFQRARPIHPSPITNHIRRPASRGPKGSTAQTLARPVGSGWGMHPHADERALDGALDGALCAQEVPWSTTMAR